MDIVVRAFFAFLFVFLLTRLIGRRELSSLEPFDLILLVVVGDLMQQGITQSDMSYTGAVLATGTFAVMVLAVSYLRFRFRRLEPLLDLGMRLGEGSGAALAIPVLKAALACHTGMATFAEAGIGRG